jgi:rhodanese-related sulfurtransferase
MTMRRISSALVIATVSVLIGYESVYAYFSPDTIKLVVQSLNPAVIGALIAFIVHAFSSFRHLSPLKKVGIILSILVLSAVPGFFVWNSVHELREINKVENVDIRKDDRWNEFVNDFEGEEGDDVYERADGTDDIDLSTASTRVNLQEGVLSGKYEVIDILCSQNPIKDSRRLCKLGFEIYSNYDDPLAVKAIMDSYGISKDDPLLLYCEAGFTTSRVAFILDRHGYNVAWGGLTDITNFELIDTSFKPKVNTDILIKNLQFNLDTNYSYFLFNYDDQNALYYNEFFWDKQPQSERYKKIKLYQVSKNYDPRLLDEIGLSVQDVNKQPINTGQLVKTKILCRNALHCYLTRQYLGYLEITDVNEVYCVNCSGNKD